MASIFVAAFCFAGLLSTIPAANTQVQTLYSGPYQILFYKANVNFNTAKERCISYGSQLLKVDSQGIKNTISSYDTSGTSYWIGARDIAEEGQFKWLDGTSVDSRYTNWNNGEPSNGGGNEDCVVAKNKGKWNDVRCNRNFGGFICQRVLKLVYKTHFLEFRRQDNDTATFYEAMTKCGQSGSRLVEVSSKNLDKKIKQNIENSNPWVFYWLGGSDRQVEGEWEWNNRTEVNYTGWSQNEPNGGGRENCLGIMRTGWVDLDCSRKELYICEKVAASEIKVSAHDLEVSSAEEQTTIVCSAKGFPFPTISWHKNGIAVSNQRSSNDLYQTQAYSEATLHLSGATLLNEGVYTCLVNNTIEGTDYAENTTSFVSVPSQVVNITAIGHTCNASITVLWKPNRRATNAFHKIVVHHGTSDEFSYIVAPKHLHETFFTNTAKNLSAYRKYNVTILPCVTATDCKSEYAVSRTALTGGIPGKVRSANTSMSLPPSCEVTWSKPDLIFGDYIYQITVNESIVDIAKGYSEMANTTTLLSGNHNVYIHTTKPNRRYFFGIQAKNCGGTGPIVWSNGSCTTTKAAPPSVPAPLILEGVNKEGKAAVTIDLPDQTNGPISCLFLIVTPDLHNNITSTESFSLENLEKVNMSISSNLKQNSFIAVALVLSSLNSRTNVSLGDENITSCDINIFGSRKRRSISNNNSSMFVGWNARLDQTMKYRIYIVSTTPSPEGVLLKVSGIQALIAKQTTTTATNTSTRNDSIGEIIGAAVGILAFFVLSVGFVLWKRKRSKIEGNENGRSNELVHFDPQGADVYENTVLKNYDDNTSIQMEKLENVYKSMLQDNGKMFTKQFENILQVAAARKGPNEFALSPELKKKNRYKNILPFDTSRVIIRSNETSYINASFIEGFNSEKKFIATQGPLPSTVTDFWLMVVEQKCTVVVMLAKCYEAGKKKCEKYWPDSGKNMQFGPVSVSCDEEIRFYGFLRRSFKVKASLKDEEVRMTVYQYHFTTWPDHGIPTTTTKLARMHDEVMRIHRTQAENTPIIVHCSAGAGRTGTFIAYNILLEESGKRNSVDVYNCVLKMREQRVDMVQNCSQFILVHKMILEHFLFGNTDMTVAEAKERFIDSNYRKNVASKQFENLSRAEAFRILLKNKSGVSPHDRTKISVFADEIESHSMDASYVETYDESIRLIAAAEPTERNAGLFWKMLLDCEVSVLVALSSKKQIDCWPADENGELNFGEVKVRLECEESTSNFDKTVITVEDADRFVLVTCLQPTDINGSCPLEGKVIVNLVSEMRRILRESPNPTAVIQCMTGLEDTGTFCVIVNLIERLNLENRVDIFRAVKDLRDCRTGMVDSLERYLVCHQAVIDYMQSFDIYSNFE